MSAPAPSAPPGPHPKRPSWALLGTEPWRAAAEFIALKATRRPRGPAGDGHPVIIYPGLASDGRAVAALRDHCCALGYAAVDWGRGWNTGPQGDVDRWLQQLADDVLRLSDNGQRAPSLIGWSLGGLYARELAKLPQLNVRQVITIGTPFNGSPASTHAGWAYRVLNGRHAAPAPALQQRLAQAPPVPTTSIYSRRDGIVAWQACRHDGWQPQACDIEVEGSHLGMGWNRQVLALVGECLAGNNPAGRRHVPCRTAKPGRVRALPA